MHSINTCFSCLIENIRYRATVLHILKKTTAANMSESRTTDLGTPAALMPVIVIIKTVSSIIRPAALAVRLAANMIADHLLLTFYLGDFSP